MAVQVESLCKPFALENDPDATYYFFHSEKEDVENEGYSTPVPTHDIWKKFKLLPTLPRSPSRSPPHSPVDFDSFGDDYCSVADILQIVSDFLDEDSQGAWQLPLILLLSSDPRLPGKIKDFYRNSPSVLLKIEASNCFATTTAKTPKLEITPSSR